MAADRTLITREWAEQTINERTQKARELVSGWKKKTIPRESWESAFNMLENASLIAFRRERIAEKEFSDEISLVGETEERYDKLADAYKAYVHMRGEFEDASDAGEHLSELHRAAKEESEES